MSEICTTGLWVDKATGQVVDSQPAEGHLLVSPGGRLTAEVKTAVERARAAAPPAAAVDADTGDEETDDAKVSESETASESGAPETAAKSGRTGTARKRT